MPDQSEATLALQVLGRCTGACVRGKDIAADTWQNRCWNSRLGLAMISGWLRGQCMLSECVWTRVLEKVQATSMR